MKKKIVAILLAVCLAVGCLPAPASAAQLTGSREELRAFIEKCYLGWNFFNFDANEATVSNDPWDNTLYYLLDRQPWDDSIYPGEDRQWFYPYDFETGEKNPNFCQDPLGKFSCETSNDYYTKTSAVKFNWMMENIFNILNENISRLSAELMNGEYCYYHEGYYYMQTGGSGGGAMGNFAISRIEQKGSLFYVTCDLYWEGKAFFIVEPKTINGNVYWTLHKAIKMDIIDGTPTLPEGFDPEEFGYDPALPPNIVKAGICGDNTSWTLDKDDLLTISGQGKVVDRYFFGGGKNVVVEEGVTDIGVFTFECGSLSTVTIPTSMTSIGSGAFADCDKLTDVYYDGTEEQWNRISIGEQNEPLLNATIHFTGQPENPVPTPTPTPAPTPTPTPDPTPTPTPTPNPPIDPYPVTPVDPTPTPTPTPTPPPTPTEPVTKTETAADGTVTTTTTWPDGKTSVKSQTPQGDTSMTVKAATGEALAVVSLPGNPGPGKQFTDVQSGWYKESVDKATALGLFSGTGANNFSPDAPMTRGMLATVLHRLSGTVGYGVGTGNFSDVQNGSWYKDAVDWAQATGVVTGTGNGFEPNKDITREQLVTMLYRYAQLIGADDGTSANIAGFADSGSVSGYAQDAMRWAVARGFVSGVGNNRLDPTGKATRAQVAAILTRFTDYLCGTTNPGTPSDTPKVQNGYYICPVCKFINNEGVDCVACEHNFEYAKPEVYCPTCGGGLDVGGVIPWVICWYCDKYFPYPTDMLFECSRCRKAGFRATDLDPESELCPNCYDPNPTYCTKCGRSSNLVTIDPAEGLCEECLGYCEICKRVLTSAENNVYNGKRCYFCSNCDYCGEKVTNEEYIKNGGFICSNCLEERTSPNVWCPNCGYGFHTTGVGIEGFICPRCKHQWMP